MQALLCWVICVQALQSSGQTLQLRMTALNHELTQKNARLEQAVQQQQQLQEQLNTANASLKAGAADQDQATKQLAELKMELDRVNIDLASKSTQLETALKSMQAAQAQVWTLSSARLDLLC